MSRHPAGRTVSVAARAHAPFIWPFSALPLVHVCSCRSPLEGARLSKPKQTRGCKVPGSSPPAQHTRLLTLAAAQQVNMQLIAAGLQHSMTEAAIAAQQPGSERRAGTRRESQPLIA